MLRYRPSNEAIVQWIYKNEGAQLYRLLGGLLRRLDAVKETHDKRSRDLASRDLQKFEARHKERLDALRADLEKQRKP
jgi:hypothetical protein